MTDFIKPRTWHWKQSLAVWSFELPVEPGEAAQAALRRHALAALGAVPGFGTVSRIEWVTESHGDDAAVYVPVGEVDDAVVAETLDRLVDVVSVLCGLDLACVGPGGQPMTLEQAATLSLNVDWLDPSRPGDGTPEIYLQLRLHTDIYSPLTWGPVRDNAELAAANAPRLARFLRFIREDMGGTNYELEAPGYVEVADASGFRIAEPQAP